MSAKPKLRVVHGGKRKPHLAAVPRTLPIQTVYYHGKSVVKKTRSGTSFRAVPTCVAHMQVNQYEASIAEVFDTSNGVLHAVIRRTVEGSIHIVFKREVKEGQ